MATTTINGGSMTISVPAMAMCHSGMAPTLGMSCLSSVTAVAWLASVVISSGHRYWFQAHRNMIVPSAAMLVRDSGSRMSTKKRNAPAPSMRAASVSSSGTVRKNCR